MPIFQFTDYRAFLRDTFRRRERKGRGQLGQLATAIGVHSTFISLVFRDKRDLSAEQALLTAQYLQLTDAETDYFLLLVQHSRTSQHQLRDFLERKIALAQENASRLENRFAAEKRLGSKERQVFYSSWHYSAIRVFTSTAEEGRSVEEICARFKLGRSTVAEALDFLVKTQLVIEKDGRYLIGPRTTYLERDHPLLKAHHTNWRLRALDQFTEMSKNEMMFTSTLSLSRKDFALLREHLAAAVKTTSDVMKETTPEDVACINIDFFGLNKLLISIG